MREGDFSSAEQHLSKCLPQCPHLGLWDEYPQFVRLTTNGDAAEMEKAYGQLLDQVGMDVDALPQWRNYIDILLASAREDSNKTVVARQAYQRAVVLPLRGVDKLWKARPAGVRAVRRQVLTVRPACAGL